MDNDDGSQGNTGALPDRYALQFDGIDDYATAGNAGFPTVDVPQAFSLWVNHLSPATTQCLIALRRFLTHGIQLGIRSGKLAAWRSSDGAALVDGPALPQGEWHHVGYAYDGKVNTLFVDGVAVATGSATTMDTRTPITAWLGTFDGVEEMFKGQMDDVRIWTVARSAADLAAEIAGQIPATSPGLVAWWGFDESSGAFARDYSGHGNRATLGDGVTMRMPARVPSTIVARGSRQ